MLVALGSHLCLCLFPSVKTACAQSVGVEQDLFALATSTSAAVERVFPEGRLSEVSCSALNPAPLTPNKLAC